MAAVADAIGDRMHARVELIENSENGEEYHAAQDFDFCST